MQIRVLLAALFALLLAGCGGGGAGSPGGGGGGATGRLNVFATDGPNDDYSKIWVTVFKIDLLSDSGTHTVFNDDSGKIVDLKTLRDQSGEIFLFLGSNNVPIKTYSGVRVVMSKNLSVVPTGGTATVAKTFADSFDDSPGKSAVTVGLPAGTHLGGGNGVLVLDFDLSQWTETAGVINPVVTLGNASAINNLIRHANEDYKGTISGLTGTSPNLSFTLNMGGGSFRVQTSASTAIFNSNGGLNPTLANDQLVEVRGTFSAAQSALIATEVKIEDGPGGFDDDEVEGPVSNLNPAAGTFTIAARQVQGFVPSNSQVNIVVTPSTIYRSDRGLIITRDQFFGALQGPVSQAEAEGTYNPATNTLTARKVKLEDEGNNNNDDARVEGTVSNINAGAGTFRVTITKWEGFSGNLGGQMNIATSAVTTDFRGDGGGSISQAAFFAQLTNGTFVEVRGRLSNGSIQASRAEIDD